MLLRLAMRMIAALALVALAACRSSTEPGAREKPTATPPKHAWSDPPREEGAARATQISVGRYHACARMSDDSLRCWGGNDWNMQASERAGTVESPAAAAIQGVVEVAAGGSFTCVRRRDRTVWCWGYNHQGQLGTAPSETVRGPAAVPAITGAVSLAAAEQTACALVDDGGIWCWGQELSPGRPARASAPVRVSSESDAVALRGKFFFCALRGDGSVWCWGPNMGAEPAPMAGLTDISEISVGQAMACARTTGGALSCWGQNDSGQLGPDSSDFERKPVPIAALAGVTAVGAGNTSACAANGDGVWCWGHEAAHPAFPPDCLRMTSHKGGGGSPLQWRFCPVPTRLDGLSGVIAIDVGTMDLCALTRDGKVFCWGGDESGRPRAPVQVSL